MKITDIPQIVVGGFEYKVRSDAECDTYLIQNNLQAEHDPFTMEFKVSTTLSEQSSAQTLVHEVIHAIVRIYGMHGTEEHDVEAMAQGWFQVIRDNPEFIIYVVEAGLEGEEHGEICDDYCGCTYADKMPTAGEEPLGQWSGMPSGLL